MSFFIIGREVSIIAVGYIFIYRLLTRKEEISTWIKETFILLVFSISGILTVSIFVPQPGYTAYFHQALQNAFSVEKILRESYQIIVTYHVGWVPILASLIRSHKRNDPLLLTSLMVGGGFLVFDHFVGMISSRFVFLTYPGFLIAIYRGIEDIIPSKMKTSNAIKYVLIILYAIIGFIGTAENNISFPTTSDASIAKLFPEDYHKEDLWCI